MSCLKARIPISEQSTHLLQLLIKVLVKMFLEQTIITTDSFRTYLLVLAMRSPDEDIGSINDV